MSWFFNADYESFLFSGRSHYTFNSSKLNQEFEYLIHFLEDGPIFTTKKYSKGYIERIEALSGKRFMTENSPENARPWWASIGDYEADKILHSKITSTKFGIEKGIIQDACLVSLKNFDPKEGHVYKMEGELSGRGHLLWPRDKKKISVLLENGLVLIEEPLRERVRDFSALFLSAKKKVVYENAVDRHFQYKGTRLIAPKLSLEQEKEYEKALGDICQFYLKLGASFPFSVDSYIYKQNNCEILNPLCEVNARKTMGYAALKLAELFQAPCASMVLLNRAQKVFKDDRILVLSPPENQFQTVFLKAKSPEELKELEALLFSGEL
ncbi:MAG: hypothetical protein WEB87_03525 [Bacteriovoracaceae bacterium]